MHLPLEPLQIPSVLIMQLVHECRHSSVYWCICLGVNSSGEN